MVVQDKCIDDLMLKFNQANAAKGTIRGYRVKIFADNSSEARRLMNEAKAKFMGNFPNDETYLEVKAPDWRLYVGNYRTKIDAMHAKKQLEKYFRDPHYC